MICFCQSIFSEHQVTMTTTFEVLVAKVEQLDAKVEQLVAKVDKLVSSTTSVPSTEIPVSRANGDRSVVIQADGTQEWWRH